MGSGFESRSLQLRESAERGLDTGGSEGPELVMPFARQ
jgi:hypothetical protein